MEREDKNEREITKNFEKGRKGEKERNWTQTNSL
jgi:hypothetical protein